MTDRVVRLTANLSSGADLALERLAEILGVSKTQALNQALVTMVGLYALQERHGAQLIARCGRDEQKLTLPKPPAQQNS